MHAFAVFKDDHRITDIELPTPTPVGTEVLLKVMHSGVCHTDAHLREGYYDLGSRGRLNLVDRGVEYPLVLGHEVVGIVEAVGPDVTEVTGGEHRLVYPWIGEGKCDACQAGQENLCATPQNLGVAKHGGYAEYILVPHPRYLVDVSGLDERWAATLACSGLTAYSAARKALPTDPTLPVVVIGAGGVDLMAIATMRALGHQAIVAVDLQERNLELARELGATMTISAAHENLADVILAETGQPVASVVDFVNNGVTAPVAFTILRKGGTMIQVGLFGGEFVIPTALLTLRIITIRGSFVGSLQELEELVDLAKRVGFPQIPIIGAELSAESAQTSLDRLATGGVPGPIVLSA